jgi:hypothetical protein
MKRIVLIILSIMLLVFSVPTLAAEGNALSINTAYDCGGGMTYTNGYTPVVSGNQVHVVLPLIGTVQNDSIVVAPKLPVDGPFLLGNYEFTLANGMFLIDRSFPLSSKRVNGTYPITFETRYTDMQGNAVTQSFTVYVTITDGIDPDYVAPEVPERTEPPLIVGQLQIDSATRYEGMAQTYAQGYVPMVRNSVATIVLPLTGRTYDGSVSITADLGATENNPFVLGNYSQTAHGRGLYVFRLDIPLRPDRINGAYPVVLHAEYLDSSGTKAKQEFTVHVTITDGTEPPDPNAPEEKEAVEKPELFISACAVNPNTVGGDEEFAVDISIENIGSIRARSVRVTYGSEAVGILPVETNNAILLEPIASGDTDTVSFMLKTTKDVLAGNQPFYITLDYVDLYGGIYTATRQFLVAVTQPASISYDPVSLPKEITAGETVSLPANVFNVGKSTLRNVTITLSGAGLFPTSSVFLGDVAPGEAGYGEMKVFIGMLSMTEGYTESYGKTNGTYTISYQDDAGETYAIDLACSTEIKKPVIEGEDEKEEEDPAAQWWMSMIVGLAIIAIIVTVMIVSRFTRLMRMK